jgi:hypothetical protein
VQRCSYDTPHTRSPFTCPVYSGKYPLSRISHSLDAPFCLSIVVIEVLLGLDQILVVLLTTYDASSFPSRQEDWTPSIRGTYARSHFQLYIPLFLPTYLHCGSSNPYPVHNSDMAPTSRVTSRNARSGLSSGRAAQIVWSQCNAPGPVTSHTSEPLPGNWEDCFDDVVTEALKYSCDQCTDHITKLKAGGYGHLTGPYAFYQRNLYNKGVKWSEARWTKETMVADFGKDMDDLAEDYYAGTS